MKAKTKQAILSVTVGIFLGCGLVGYIFGIGNGIKIIKLEKENKALWSALYDNQERMNGLADFQREQAEVVIQIADKINGAVMVGISDKEVLEEMKRREAYISE